MQVISNESMKFDDPKVFDDSQVFDDPKEIAIGSMDFHKVYGDTSIFDGLLLWGSEACLYDTCSEIELKLHLLTVKPIDTHV